MDIVSIIASIFICYLFIVVAVLNLLFCYEGNCDSSKQEYKNVMLFSNKLYSTCTSINGKDYSNKLNVKYAVIITFIPVLNIVWLITTLYKFYNILYEP